jgi:hypothetical protein
MKSFPLLHLGSVRFPFFRVRPSARPRPEPAPSPAEPLDYDHPPHAEKTSTYWLLYLR